MNLDLSDVAIVIATIVGPVLAAQAQKWIERSRERNNRRVAIFRTIMATRLAGLSIAHVEALNAIPIEFYGGSKQHREVVNSWRSYLDHLNQEQLDAALWGQRRYDLFVDLLWRLAQALGYQFTKLELQREVYSPRGDVEVEQEQEVIRRGFYKIFKGEAAFPLDIGSVPINQEQLEAQLSLHRLLREWLDGTRAAKVSSQPIQGGDPPEQK